MIMFELLVLLLFLVCDISQVVGISDKNPGLCKDVLKLPIQAMTLSDTHLYFVIKNELYKFPLEEKYFQPDKLLLSDLNCEQLSLKNQLRNGSDDSFPRVKSMFIAKHQSSELKCYVDDNRKIHCFSELTEKKQTFDDLRRGILSFNGTNFGVDIIHQKFSSHHEIEIYKGMFVDSSQLSEFNFTMKQRLTLYMHSDKTNSKCIHVLLVDSNQITNVSNLNTTQLEAYGLDKKTFINFEFNKLTKALPLSNVIKTTEMLLYYKQYLYFITENWVFSISFDYDSMKPLQSSILNLYNRESFLFDDKPKYEDHLDGMLTVFRVMMMGINVLNVMFLVYYYRRNKDNPTSESTPTTTPYQSATGSSIIKT